MCAIAGVMHLDGDRPDPRRLDRMLAIQRHRGPDDEGRLFDGPVALGHLRLAILDLTSAGHQPMATDDRTLWIVFNGEIFNYVELRRELETAGHDFRTATDTEVILHAYRAWGPACLERLNGMFAFALWDGRARELFCVRDRLGVKPFYYVHDGRRFLFASEIKGVLADHEVSREPNLDTLAGFLGSGILDDGTETCFRSVRQLPPGHFVRLTEGRPEVRPTPWWRLPQRALTPRPDVDQAASRVRALLEDAVRLRLRSDVPVGTCLSGGIDSSTIACLASAQLRPMEGRLRSFSSRTHDPRLDEGRYIDEVARLTDAEAHSVFPGGVDFVADLERVVWHQEEPFHSPSVFAQYEVMRLAREAGVKVLLDGQAGDELFAGYYYFVPPYLADLAARGRWPRLRREWTGHVRLHAVHPGRLRRAVVRAGAPQTALRLVRAGLARGRATEGAAPWLGRALSGRRGPRVPPVRGRDRLHAALAHALLRSPLPNYLHHEDRNSMAWSIEARTPFLDYRLVEFVTGLPAEHKIADGWNKAVLREAMRGIIPEAVRLRADKQGFSTPHTAWYRAEAAELMRDLLTSGRTAARGLIDPAWAHTAVDRLIAGTADDELLVWRCAVVELWARVMLDQPLESGMPPQRSAHGRQMDPPTATAR